MSSSDIRSRTGRGVRIGVIDSGITPRHPHVGQIAGGCMLSEMRGRIVRGDDSRDRSGHGTAVAGVLRAKLPDAEIYAIRIFLGALVAPPMVVAAALDWAVGEGLDLVNLSLGSRHPEAAAAFEPSLERAHQEGTIVVAAAPADGALHYPAADRRVLSASDDGTCGWDDLQFRPQALEEANGPGNVAGLFLAHGHPRPMPGLAAAQNFQGPSFAAAHVSTFVARILESDPELRGASLHRELVALAESVL